MVLPRLGSPHSAAQRSLTRFSGGLNGTAHTSCVMLRERGRTTWEDYISGRVTAIAGNANFSAVGCEDGSLYIYSPTGRRVL